MAFSLDDLSYDSLDPRFKPWWRRKKNLVAIAVGIAMLIFGIVLIVAVAKKPNNQETAPLPPLTELMNSTNIKNYLQSFQSIAETHGGSRSAIHGYNASVEYIKKQIETHTNYSIEIQEFDFWLFWSMTTPVIAQTYPNYIYYVSDQDFIILKYSASGNVSANLNFVGGGCEAADYSKFIPGDIALVLRYTPTDCSIQEKVSLASAMGASAVILWINLEQYALWNGGLNQTSTIPAFMSTFAWGSAMSLLMETYNVTLTIKTNTVSKVVPTSNIIVDTMVGDPKQTIIVGSHLDSVPVGPGMNDNGSGSTVNLELALQYMKSNVSPRNRVKFAWWGGEELGLFGSYAYVSHLNKTKRLEDVAVYLNYDMVGSINYVTYTFNGSTAWPARDLSTTITHMYEKYLKESGTPYELSEMFGGTDYVPFMEAGIPVGGMFSGLDDKKTAAQKAKYGGMANVPCDPCYHQPCDTIDNISIEAMMITAKAAAYVLETLAGSNLKAL